MLLVFVKVNPNFDLKIKNFRRIIRNINADNKTIWILTRFLKCYFQNIPALLLAIIEILDYSIHFFIDFFRIVLI
jgi:hypothetical protein